MITPFKRPFMLLLTVAILLFFSNFDLLTWSTFSDDDTHVSQLALSYGWLEPYYKPEVYQQLSIVHFTPIVLSIYRAILSTFGLNNIAFVIFQLTAITITAALAAHLCERITKQVSAGLICLVLTFSNVSLLPMLSRFYTAHYLLGAILSLLILFLIRRAVKNKQLQQSSFLLWLGTFTFLALLTKEIYIMLVPLLWVVFYKLQAVKAFIAVTLSLILYFLLRAHILGVSNEGRSGDSFLSAILALNLDTWADFIYWYLTTKWLIIISVCIAFIRAPRVMFEYTLLASLFAAPALAAPHAFQNPQLHGDRLFFMFDIAIIISSVLAIYSRPIAQKPLSIILLCTLLGLIPLQRYFLHSFSLTQTNTANYTINQALLNQTRRTDTIVFTPLNYYQGEFMNIYRLLNNPWLTIIQNCQRALQLTTPTHKKTKVSLLAFDETGTVISRNDVMERCQESHGVATVKTPPTFNNGLLSWSFSVPDGHTGGILLIDRGIAVGAGEFQQRLVRPKPDERYQIYTRKNNMWWFSDINFINVSG